MKRYPIIALVIFSGIVPGFAQTVAEDPQPDPVLDAIHEFSEREGKPVQPEPEKSKDAASEKLRGEVAETNKDIVAPAKEDPSAIAALANSGQSLAEPKKPEGDGLVVRVEKLQTPKGTVDPAKVKLLSPFPAKPLGVAPTGWKLEASNSAPPFSREVEISPGSRITLTIRPHLLVPEADGEHVFSVRETGYDHTLGYQQSATVGAILASSVRQLDEDAKRLDSVIDNLQQLLISLPKPEVSEQREPAELTAPVKPAPIRKR